MKKLLTALACASMSCAFAAGPLDGIYSCEVSGASGYSQAYVTVNTNAANYSLFAVAAVQPSQDFFGYGVGVVTDQTFNGNTMFGAPFAFTRTNVGFAGTIGILLGGSIVTAGAYCTRVW
jgi:hypothetical protein